MTCHRSCLFGCIAPWLRFKHTFRLRYGMFYSLSLWRSTKVDAQGCTERVKNDQLNDSLLALLTNDAQGVHAHPWPCCADCFFVKQQATACHYHTCTLNPAFFFSLSSYRLCTAVTTLLNATLTASSCNVKTNLRYNPLYTSLRSAHSVPSRRKRGLRKREAAISRDSGAIHEARAVAFKEGVEVDKTGTPLNSVADDANTLLSGTTPLMQQRSSAPPSPLTPCRPAIKENLQARVAKCTATVSNADYTSEGLVTTGVMTTALPSLFLPDSPSSSATLWQKWGESATRDEEPPQLLEAAERQRPSNFRSNSTKRRACFNNGSDTAAPFTEVAASHQKSSRRARTPTEKGIAVNTETHEKEILVSPSRCRSSNTATPVMTLCYRAKNSSGPALVVKRLASGAGDADQHQQGGSAVARPSKSSLQARSPRRRLLLQQIRQQRELPKRDQFSSLFPDVSNGEHGTCVHSAETLLGTPTSSCPGAAAKPPTESEPPSRSCAPTVTDNPLYFPDHREQVLLIFQRLAKINLALGERYKTQSYQVAVERLKKDDAVFKLLPPHLMPLPKRVAELGPEAEVRELLLKRAYALDPSQPIPGAGDKLRKKIVEILTTGDLAELHTLQSKPIIRALQQLTRVHGFGPRTAMAFYKDYGISTVEELKMYAEEHDLMGPEVGETGGSSGKGKSRGGFSLTDAQRIGLEYYEDIQQRIPHSECRLHEVFLKLRLRKHLGCDYELTVCGSYRRRTATSGDIDVLITRRGGTTADADPLNSSRNALATFTASLHAERYIEATLAQGSTKFMGVCRLRNLEKPSAPGEPPAVARRFLARRIDIRFVDASSYPAALLYFTGSKNFNVVMRVAAIKKNFILNEYGLFRNNSGDISETGKLHEMIGQLSKAQYYTSKKDTLNYLLSDPYATGDGSRKDDSDSDITAGKRGRRGSGKASASKMQLAELLDVLQRVEALRVKVKSEKDIFNAICMNYVEPEDRNV